MADIIETVLEPYARIPYAHGDMTCEAVFDRPRGRFILITVGWNDDERVDDVLVHIDIINGKVWIQTDNTEHGVAPELVQAGVPKSDIVLGFQSPDVLATHGIRSGVIATCATVRRHVRRKRWRTPRVSMVLRPSSRNANSRISLGDSQFAPAARVPSRIRLNSIQRPV